MKIYKGKVNLVGAGTWEDGVTKLSVLEIGDKRIKDIYLSDYLSNYIIPGNNISILVGSGIRKYSVVAVRNNGRKYSDGLGKTLLWFVLAIILGIITYISMWREVAIGCLLICGYQLKNIIDYFRF